MRNYVLLFTYNRYIWIVLRSVFTFFSYINCTNLMTRRLQLFERSLFKFRKSWHKLPCHFCWWGTNELSKLFKTDRYKVIHRIRNSMEFLHWVHWNWILILLNKAIHNWVKRFTTIIIEFSLIINMVVN